MKAEVNEIAQNFRIFYLHTHQNNCNTNCHTSNYNKVFFHKHKQLLITGLKIETKNRVRDRNEK